MYVSDKDLIIIWNLVGYRSLKYYTIVITIDQKSYGGHNLCYLDYTWVYNITKIMIL